MIVPPKIPSESPTLRLFPPIAKTGMVTKAIFFSILSWNEFIMAAILMRSATKTFIAYDALFKSAQNLNLGDIASVIVIGAIPIVILFIFTKKQFVKGISWGEVKE